MQLPMLRGQIALKLLVLDEVAEQFLRFQVVGFVAAVASWVVAYALAFSP